MTDNEKLARWQGLLPNNTGCTEWFDPKTNYVGDVYDYLNDDAAAMILLDTLVEKGFLPVLRISDVNDRVWRVAVYDNYCDKQWVEINGKPTRREAVVSTVLRLIEKEN